MIFFSIIFIIQQSELSCSRFLQLRWSLFCQEAYWFLCYIYLFLTSSQFFLIFYFIILIEIWNKIRILNDWLLMTVKGFLTWFCYQTYNCWTVKKFVLYQSGIILFSGCKPNDELHVQSFKIAWRIRWEGLAERIRKKTWRTENNGWRCNWLKFSV